MTQSQSVKCPHCLVAIHWSWTNHPIGQDSVAKDWNIQWATCPACKRLSIRLVRNEPQRPNAVDLVWPRVSGRTPAPPEVPAPYSTDYHEACLVLGDSPKASAALSRRCLQQILAEKAGATKRDLFDQIQDILDAKSLPTHLAEALDAVRAIGNFGAHPIKSKSSGAVVEVEPGEAEWNLDTLEGRFDFFFVQPAILRKKRDALDAKLKDAGKPTLR